MQTYLRKAINLHTYESTACWSIGYWSTLPACCRLVMINLSLLNRLHKPIRCREREVLVKHFYRAILFNMSAFAASPLSSVHLRVNNRDAHRLDYQPQPRFLLTVARHRIRPTGSKVHCCRPAHIRRIQAQWRNIPRKNGGGKCGQVMNNVEQAWGLVGMVGVAVGILGLLVGMVGLVVGMVGLVMGMVGLVMGMVGLVVGMVGLVMGIVGLVVGIVGLVVGMIELVVGVVGLIWVWWN